VRAWFTWFFIHAHVSEMLQVLLVSAYDICYYMRMSVQWYYFFFIMYASFFCLHWMDETASIITWWLFSQILIRGVTFVISWNLIALLLFSLFS
jgi:hypothetical protein